MAECNSPDRPPSLLRGRTANWLWVFSVILLALGCRPSSVVSSPKNLPQLSLTREEIQGASQADNLARAEQTFEKGQHRREESDSSSTGLFLEATSLAWQVVCETAVVGGPRHERAGALYHDSLRQLIESAQLFGQLDPLIGLNVATTDGVVQIPIRYHAFAWQPEDFSHWIPVRDYEVKPLARKHERVGWGIPLVVVRQRDVDERFMTKAIPFSATALLRPAVATNPGEQPSFAGHVLEVFNPLAVKTLPKDDGSYTPLAADTSAPIAWFSQNAPQLNFEAFLHPDRVRSSGQLIMLEPYQPGKIPVIFTHGLLSGPLTWSSLINELRASDWFNQRYQVWVFGYSTGRPFLRSAADMRRECWEAFTSLAGGAPDPALQRAVLIGHSMGGLVSKLQITYSDAIMWDSFANRPLESLQTDYWTHQYLSDLLFFQPLPFVERVVFIGTPHGGSPIADEWIGHFASHLVSREHEFSDEYKTFLAQNSGAVMPFFAKHIPSSVEMLESQDPCLQAMRQLRVAPRVRMHSVIGTGQTMLVGGPADGVVPVESARHADVDSELQVPATHRHLQSHPDTVQEVLRILMLHLQESPELRRSQFSDSSGELPHRDGVAADPA